MINKVILIGNLGRDPEIRHLEGGTAVGRFSVATNESYKDKSGEWQKVTEWHDVVVWRNLAERAERQLSKGSLVYIEGKLAHRKWQDREGNDRYTTEVVANTFRKLDRRDENTGLEQSWPTEEPAMRPGVSESTGTSGKADNGSSEDDLPF